MQTKIQKAGLVPILVNLFEKNMTEAEIASQMTAFCIENGIRDDQTGDFLQISQSTVNRTLKPIRRKFESKAQEKINKHIDAHIESDLKVVEEATNYHIIEARAAEDYKTKSDAYMKGCRIIFEKLKTALGGPGEEDVAEQIAREFENLDPAVKEKIHAISKGAGGRGLSGPH